MNYATGGQVAVVNPVNMTTPRAKDFQAHYPLVGHQIDDWNRIASGYRESAYRYQALTNRAAEKATQGRATGLPMLLNELGRGDLAIGAITWRVQNNQLEASWALDVFNEPAFSPMLAEVTEQDVENAWQAISTFGDLREVKDWSARVDAVKRLRPALLDALEHVEIAVDLKGKCEHCPP